MFKWLRKTALWIVAIPTLAFALGLASNQAVLVANRDTFPVRINAAKFVHRANACVAEAQAEEDNEAALMCVEMAQNGYLDYTHVVMTDQTHLNALADNFDFGEMGTWSIGDILLELGGTGMGLMWPIWFFMAVGKLSKKEE